MRISMIIAILAIFLSGSGLALESSFSIMTYNVENLFDNIHDPGKDDMTYLEKSHKNSKKHIQSCLKKQSHRKKECLELDWTTEKIAAKLDSLAQAIQIPFGSVGPDILVLSEVENKAMLEALRARMPQAHYGPGILIENSDPRGIDSAVLTRFPTLGEPKLNPLPKSSRGALQVKLRFQEKWLVNILAIHFPAPYHGTDVRVAAFEGLNLLANQPLESHGMTLAAGDFNVTSENDGFFYRKLASIDWYVSHLEGCKSCQGSYYYKPKKSWSFLDALLIKKNSINQICRFQPDKIAVVDTHMIVPRPSDHLPLVAMVECIDPKNLKL